MVALVSATYLYTKKDFMQIQPALCESASTADRIRGNYENKIRFFAPPEKIFEVFATHQGDDGALSMNYSDFMRALTPYNYCSLKEEKEINAYLRHHEKMCENIFKLSDPD
jgi:hypothetical protein